MLLAVYGTLKAGFHNHGILGASTTTYKGSCWIDNFALLDEGYYPAAFRFAGRKIWVEVYEIDADTLRKTDALEGASRTPCYYSRESVKTPHGDAYMYARLDRPLTELTEWFPDGIWYGTPSYRVKWQGWDTEIKLCGAETKARQERQSQVHNGSAILLSDLPSRPRGRLVKVYDASTDSFEYVPEAEAEGLPRERPPQPPTKMERAREMINEVIKDGDKMPEEKIA